MHCLHKHFIFYTAAHAVDGTEGIMFSGCPFVCACAGLYVRAYISWRFKSIISYSDLFNMKFSNKAAFLHKIYMKTTAIPTACCYAVAKGRISHCRPSVRPSVRLFHARACNSPIEFQNLLTALISFLMFLSSSSSSSSNFL